MRQAPIRSWRATSVLRRPWCEPALSFPRAWPHGETFLRRRFHTARKDRKGALGGRVVLDRSPERDLGKKQGHHDAQRRERSSQKKRSLDADGEADADR